MSNWIRKRKISLILFLILIVNQFNSPHQIDANNDESREVAEEWRVKIGSNDHDEPRGLIQTIDSGYTFIYESIGLGYHQSWIHHVNENGEAQWEQFYSEVSIRAILQSTDGGYVLAGEQFGIPWFARTGPSGNILWWDTYGQTGSFNSIIKTEDGAFTFVGKIDSKILIMKSFVWHHSYKFLWSNSYDPYSFFITSRWSYLEIFDAPISVYQTEDKGYIIAGQINVIYAFSKPVGVVYFIKIDEFGDQQTGNSISGLFVHGIKENNEGGYVISTNINAPDYNINFVKTDAQFTVVEQNSIGRKIDTAVRMISTFDDNYIIGGFGQNDSSNFYEDIGLRNSNTSTISLFKINNNSDIIWHAHFGDNDISSYYPIYLIETSNDEFVILATLLDHDEGDIDMWLMKVRVIGRVGSLDFENVRDNYILFAIPLSILLGVVYIIYRKRKRNKMKFRQTAILYPDA
ncbi:MAG: hypothetical protein ACW98K_09340 [Candidatus Kariarchaeaceae archaeon]|jgi:hypothetical protein